MRAVQIVHGPSATERREIAAHVEKVAQQRGRRPLSDHLWLDLIGGDDHQTGNGMIAVTVAATDGDAPLAYAQVSAANETAVLEAWSDPGDDETLLDDVVDTAVDAFRRGGGGELSWWVDDGPRDTARDAAMGAIAARQGLVLARTLHEMRRPLPHPEPATIVTRGFDDADSQALLEVNNRAFAGHREQGGWTIDTLRLRQGEPWYRRDDVRVVDVNGSVAGFCWVKRHSPELAEIYVIAVDPDHHGHGLGRQLTLAGLAWMHDHGATQANLFVDAANPAAMTMYSRLGFEIVRTRRAFAGTLEGL